MSYFITYKLMRTQLTTCPVFFENKGHALYNCVKTGDYHLHFHLNFSNKSHNIPPFFRMEKSCLFLHGWTWYLYATYLLLWHLLKCPLHTLIHAHRVVMLDFVIIYHVCYSFSSFSVSRFYRRRTKKHWSFAKPCIKEESAPLLWLFLILARGTCLLFLSFF